MKKVLLLVCVIMTIMLASCGEPEKTTYSREELEEAIYEAERRAYQRGYDEGEYYAKGEIEQAKHELEGNLERFKSEYGDVAYEAGYEHGYENGYDDGYDDCLEEHGLVEKPAFDPDDPPRINKDK